MQAQVNILQEGPGLSPVAEVLYHHSENFTSLIYLVDKIEVSLLSPYISGLTKNTDASLWGLK